MDQKLNSDGSCLSNQGGESKISAGGIFRDSHGNWKYGFACFLRHGSSLLAELWAIYLGITIAKNACYDPIIIESVCLFAVNLLSDIQDNTTHNYAGSL